MNYVSLLRKCIDTYSEKRNCIVDFACGGLRQSFYLADYFEKVIAYDFNKNTEWREWQLSILNDFKHKDKIDLENDLINLADKDVDLCFFSWPEYQFVDSIIEDMKKVKGRKIVICKSRIEKHEKEDIIMDLQNAIQNKKNTDYPSSIYNNQKLLAYFTEYIDDLVPQEEYKRLTEIDAQKPLGYVDVFVME